MLRTKEQCMEVIQLHFVSFRENIFKLHETHEIALSCAQNILKVLSLVQLFPLITFASAGKRGPLYLLGQLATFRRTED